MLFREITNAKSGGESMSKNKQRKMHDWTREDFVEYRKAIYRMAQRKRRAEAKKNGQCAICAANPARPGMKTCADCSSRANAKKRNEIK